jgi:hypothetical protein
MGWSQVGNIANGRNSSESISIGVKAVQMMILVVRKDPAMLPMVRKMIMSTRTIPINAALHCDAFSLHSTSEDCL